jgi:hypothetical protein
MTIPKLKDFPQPAQPAVGTVVKLPKDLRTSGNKYGLVTLWEKSNSCKDCVLSNEDICEARFLCSQSDRTDKKEVLLTPCLESGKLL